MNDYISREGTIKKIAVAQVKATTGIEDVTYYRSIKIIREMPSADVQPVEHGRWESSQRTIETGTVYCSNCAIEYYVSDLQTVGDCNGIVHYCPNCGARMDGGAENDD